MTQELYGLGLTALWPSRWPLIAKQSCIDLVASEPQESKEMVKWELPCDTCELNTECLTAKEKEVGSLMYDREYLTRPRASSSSLFPYERMLPNLRFDMSLVDWYKKPLGAEERYGVATGWDLAWSEKAGGDYLAKLTGMIDRKTGKKRLLDINRWQKKAFTEQCAMMEESHAAYRDDLVAVEDDVAQVVWKQHLTATTSVPVIGHSAGQKKDFEMGVPGMLIDIERANWEIPYEPGSRNHDMTKAFLGECEAFGWQDDKLQGVGEHDDLVMAWYHLDWALNRLKVPIARTGVASRDERAEL